MNNPLGSVAVLLFSLSAVQEARRKPLCGSVRRSERLWSALERITLSKIEAANLPTFVSHQLPETGNGSFGEQLQQAVQAVLNQGYESVICVGNDCPTLRPSDLRNAAQLLQAGVAPVGIDKRGGTYLIGFTRASLAGNDELRTLPWQTSSLAPALLTYLHQCGEKTAVLTAHRADWNARAEVRINDVTGAKKWLHVLIEAFALVNTGCPPIHISFLASCQSASVGLRAPPALAQVR